MSTGKKKREKMKTVSTGSSESQNPKLFSTFENLQGISLKYFAGMKLFQP